MKRRRPVISSCCYRGVNGHFVHVGQFHGETTALFVEMREEAEQIAELVAQFHVVRVPRLDARDVADLRSPPEAPQPFGFTWEDVRLVREMAEEQSEYNGYEHTVGFLNDLADRIAALLPPEAP